MRSLRQPAPRKLREGGYALLLVVFLVTLLLVSVIAAAPDILTEGRREKEKEMIWRGKQYVRGVKLHYRKLGRFPTSLDDLTKPKVGSLRFLRQAYKDPMNKEDGSWRLIYVGPGGQLVGSLKPSQQVLQLPRAGGTGTPPGRPAGGPSGPPGGTAAGTNPAGTSPAGTTGTPAIADQSDSGSNAQQIPSGDTPAIIGGNIIGVGSKVNKSSIIVYDNAANYRLFEFIWNPAKDNLGAGQPGLQTGTGLGQPAGQTPLGQPPSQNPNNPPPNPPPPNPPQQQ